MIDYETAASVYVVTEEFQPYYLIENYSSLIWTERYNKAGDFELTIPIEEASEVLDIVKIDSFLQLDESLSESIMIVETISITSDAEDGDYLIIKGRSAESLLDRRVVWKQHTLNDFDIDIVVRKLVKENVTDPELYDRRFVSMGDGHKMVWYADPSDDDDTIKNTNMSGEYVGDNVYDVVSGLCQQHGFGFRMYTANKTYDIYKVKTEWQYTHKITTTASTTWSQLTPETVSSYTYTIKSNTTCEMRTISSGKTLDYWTGTDTSVTKSGTLAAGSKFLGITSRGSGTSKIMQINAGTNCASTVWVKYDTAIANSTSGTATGTWLYSTNKAGASNRVAYLTPSGTTLSNVKETKWYNHVKNASTNTWEWVEDATGGYEVTATINGSTYTGYIIRSAVNKAASGSESQLVIYQDKNGDGTYESTISLDTTNTYYMYVVGTSGGYSYGDIKYGDNYISKCKVATTRVSSTTTTYDIIPLYKTKYTSASSAVIVAWIPGSGTATSKTSTSSTTPSSWVQSGDWLNTSITYDFGGSTTNGSSYYSYAWDLAVANDVVSSSTATETANKGWFMFIMSKFDEDLEFSGLTPIGSRPSDSLAKSGKVTGYLKWNQMTIPTAERSLKKFPMYETASTSGTVVENFPGGTILIVGTTTKVSDSDSTSDTYTTFYQCSARKYEDEDQIDKDTTSKLYYGYFSEDDVEIQSNAGSANVFNFQMYNGKDLSEVIKFSPKFDNIADVAYASDYTDYRNVCMVMGETDNKRTWAYTPLAETDSTILYFNRRETYSDQTSVDNIRRDSSGNAVAATDSDGNYLYQTSSDSCKLYSSADSTTKVTDTEWSEGTSVTYSGTPDEWKAAKEAGSKIYVTIGSYSGYCSASSITTVDDVLDDDEYAELLKGKGVKELSESEWPVSMDGEVYGDCSYEYGKDYNMGDLVYVETGYGQSGTARITEMIFSYDNDGFELYPTFEFQNQETAFEYEDSSSDDENETHYYDEAWRQAKRKEIIEDSVATDKANKGWFMYECDLLGLIPSST